MLRIGQFNTGRWHAIAFIELCPQGIKHSMSGCCDFCFQGHSDFIVFYFEM